MSAPTTVRRSDLPQDRAGRGPRRRAGRVPGGQGAVAAGAGRGVDAGRLSRVTGLPARLLLAVAAGLLLVLAFPGHDSWFVAAPATALLCLALRGRGARSGALLGAAFGLASFIPLLGWSGIYVGPVPWLLLAVSQAAFLAVFGAVAAAALRVPGWPVWYAALWVAVEAARGRVPFGGFPWARLAFSQADAPTLATASLGGAPAVTFVVALAGGLLAAAVVALARADRGTRARVAVAGACLAGAVAVTAGPLLIPRPTAGQARAGGPTSVRVALVQGNVARSGLTRDSPEQVLLNHIAATNQLAADIAAGRQQRPDLVLWPENASDIDLLADGAAGGVVTAAARRVGAPIVVGAILDGSGDADTVDPDVPVHRNAMIVWTPDGPVSGPAGLYVKRLPVPFGEYIPLRSLARRVSSAVDLVPVDMTAGKRVGALRVGPAVVGPAICFEVAFDGILRDDVRAGADLLAVPTNNSTFGFTDESVQQLAMSRLRAVEHGRSVLHASTVGVSAIITPDGVAHGETSLFTRAVVTGQVPLRTTETVADRVGAWPEAIVSLVGLLAAVAGVAAARRGRRRVRAA